MPRISLTLLRFNALSDETRLQVLGELRMRGAATLTELAERLAVPRRRLGPHMRRLLDAGLVVAEGSRSQRFSVSRASLSSAADDIRRLGEARGAMVEDRPEPLEGEG